MASQVVNLWKDQTGLGPSCVPKKYKITVCTVLITNNLGWYLLPITFIWPLPRERLLRNIGTLFWRQFSTISPQLASVMMCWHNSPTTKSVSCRCLIRRTVWLYFSNNFRSRTHISLSNVLLCLMPRVRTSLSFSSSPFRLLRGTGPHTTHW